MIDGNRWSPIETAPMDGTEIDIWVVRINDAGLAVEGQRVTDVWWGAEPDSGRPAEGWLKYDERDERTILAVRVTYQATHWMKVSRPH